MGVTFETMAGVENPAWYAVRGSRAATAWLIALVLLAVLLLAAPNAMRTLLGRSGEGLLANADTAFVTTVIDGDTIEIEGGELVRIIGLNAPETHHPDMAGPQPLGPEAAARMRELVGGRVVGLERDAEDRDQYGRLLRHVWLDQTLVAEVMLREGLAHTLTIPPNTMYVSRLRAAEDEARAEGRGVWGLSRPTPIPAFRDGLTP